MSNIKKLLGNVDLSDPQDNSSEIETPDEPSAGDWAMISLHTAVGDLEDIESAELVVQRKDIEEAIKRLEKLLETARKPF